MLLCYMQVLPFFFFYQETEVLFIFSCIDKQFQLIWLNIQRKNDSVWYVLMCIDPSFGSMADI